MVKIFLFTLFLNSFYGQMLLAQNNYFQNNSGTNYHQEDLNALYHAKSYEEYFQHVKDISPQKRNKVWKNQLNEMIDSYSSLLLKNDVTHNLFVKIEELSNWDEAKESIKFQLNRISIAKNYFTLCLKESELNVCKKDFENFWKNKPSDPQDSLFFLNISEQTKSNIGSYKIIEAAVKSSLAEIYCQKEEINKILASEMVKKENNLDLLMHPRCWKHFKNNYLNSYKTANSPFPTAVFEILNERKMLNENEKNLMSVLLFNTDLPKGTLLNYTWNRIEKLRKQSSGKKYVITHLRNYKYLPDKLLALPKAFEKETKVKLLIKNLPDYFDLYLRKCLAYYKGSESFPEGNPTPNCKVGLEYFPQNKMAMEIKKIK